MNYDFDASYIDSSSDSEAWPYDSEYAEAGPRRPGPVRPATGRPLNTPRPGSGATGNFVTQAQFDAAMTKTRSEMTANANAIKTVDGRVRTVIGDVQKLSASTKKDIDKLRSDLRTTQTLSALIPLIAPPGSKFGQIAPLVHLVGTDFYGGSSSSGGSGSGSGSSMLGNNSNLITIGALLYAGGFFGK